MHVKELLFRQKLERNQAAQVLEQKRALSDQLDATQAETRSLKHALQLEKSTTASMEGRRFDVGRWPVAVGGDCV